jgi:type 1 glutamine amidotransferase
MKFRWKRILLWVLLAIVALFAIQTVRYWDTIQRVFLGGVKVYETTPPAIPSDLKRPAILVFSKTNGFRHEEAIPAGNALFTDMAQKNGWGIFKTENGATFSPEILSRFDAVVFNNTSGDVFTPDQRQAFQGFLENGGGFVGIHAAGDSSREAWKWYTDELIGTHFTQHTMKPQFQKATVKIEDAAHPATKGLPSSWDRTEEWYSFDKSPRGGGAHILATVDEKTYNPEGMFGKDLRMGDHPAVWTRCVGKGRVLYSIMGHQASAFAEPEYRQLLQGALNWVMRKEGEGCDPAPAAAKP